MVYWKYINMQEFIPEYNYEKSALLESFLSHNCEFLNGKNKIIGEDLANQILVHNYRSLDDDLSITRRLEQSYPLNNGHKIFLKNDELMIKGSQRQSVEQFINRLRNEFYDF